MNAREGIKTYEYQQQAIELGKLKTMNAREGIKTYDQAKDKDLRQVLLKTMNAREGIKTNAKLVACGIIVC